MTARSRESPSLRRYPRVLRAFEDRNYRLLWSSNALYYSSRWMQIIAVSWLVLDLTDSPWRVALVAFFGWAPMLLLGLVGGLLADSARHTRLIAATLAASLIASVAITFLSATGNVNEWHAYMTVLVTGAGWALTSPARRALIYNLRGPSGATNALALDSVGMSASRMVGPAVAGGLIALVKVTGAFAAVSVLLGVSLVLAAMMTESQGRRGKWQYGAVLRDLAEGMRYVSGNTTIKAAVMITLIMNLLFFPYTQMVPVIARDTLGVGPGLMGLMLAADGLGASVGAIVFASAARVSNHGRVFAGGAAIALLGLLALALSRWYPLALPVMVVMGLGMSGFSVMQSLIVLMAARDDMRGRALGVISLAIGASPLGALLVGAVATARSPSFALALNACVGVALVFLVTLLIPSFTRRVAPPPKP